MNTTKAPIDRDAPRYLPPLVLLSLGLFILMFQNTSVGFEPGHHGWVSSHTLAIFDKATPSNCFVGYTHTLKNSEGTIDYEYFDRYPVFYSTAMNLILSGAATLQGKVRLARQVMNLVYIGILVLLYAILRKLVPNTCIALAAASLALSGYFFAIYRDMVHFDQPAILGLLLLIYAIALYRIDGKRLPLYLAALVAVSLGRGYASYAVMALWAALESFLILRHSQTGWRLVARSFITHDSIRILILGLLWGTGLLTYNISVEASKRNIHWTETGILESALQRTSLEASGDEPHDHDYSAVTFTMEQLGRLVFVAVPLIADPALYNGNQLFQYAMGAIYFPSMLYIVWGCFRNEKNRDKRVILSLLVFSGFVWLFPMHRLAWYHHYTALYYIGIPAVFYAGVLSRFATTKRAAIVSLSAAVALFLVANITANRAHTNSAREVNLYTYDFERIHGQIGGPGKNIHIDGGHQNLIPGTKYAAGFYLSRHFLTPLEIADYAISSDPNYRPGCLTPSNQRLFLFAER